MYLSARSRLTLDPPYICSLLLIIPHWAAPVLFHETPQPLTTPPPPPGPGSPPFRPASRLLLPTLQPQMLLRGAYGGKAGICDLALPAARWRAPPEPPTCLPSYFLSQTAENC